MAIVIGLLYVLSHNDMITKTAESLYPGSRRTTSGDLPIIALFDGFLMPLLQGATKGVSYYTNQSEASNFILLLPFLVIPGIFIQAFSYIKNKKINWPFAMVQLCSLLFIARAIIPADNILYHALLLDRVPNNRLRIGFGFAGLIQLLYLIKLLPKMRISKRSWIIAVSIYCAICFTVIFLIGQNIMQKYPMFLNSYVFLMVLAIMFVCIIALFLAKKPLLGSALLLIFTLGSAFNIVPLYRGLGFLKNSEIISKIKEVSKPESKWITVDNIYYINLPAAAGRGLVSGSQGYPDPELWSQVGGKKYEKIYNRTARALYVTDPEMKEKMRLVAPNYFQLKFECDNFIAKNVDFALSDKPLDYPCLKPVDKVTYPKTTFYIYSITP